MPPTRLLVLIAFLGIALACVAAEKPSNPAAQLAQYAQALRAQPAGTAYTRLQLFAEQERGSELGARAALLLGLVDFEQKRWTRAQEHFTHACRSELLGDYARWYLARTLVEGGALEVALEKFEEFSRRYPQSRLRESVLVEQAALLLRLGRAEAAKALLTTQPDWQQRPALLLALAQALVTHGEQEAAAEILHRIYYEFPLSAQAELSNQLLSELRPQLGHHYPIPSEAQRRTRAERLWAAQAYQGARSAYVDLSVRATEPTRQLARLRAAQAFYYLGGGQRACAELESISEVAPELEAEWRAYRAQCRLRADDAYGFARELDVLATQFASSHWYAQELFTGGSYFLATGDIARARTAFEQLLEKFPQSAWVAQGHWKLAWLHYLQGNSVRAARLMEEHLTRFPDAASAPQALYWRARLAERAGEVALVTHLRELLRTHYPRHYLTQQAAQRHWVEARAATNNSADTADWLPAWTKTVRLMRPKVESQPVPAHVTTLFERANALEQLALLEFAAEELSLARVPHPELCLARARLAFALGKYAEAIEWARRGYLNYYNYALEDLSRAVWELLFPRVYWETIRLYARRYGLDPYLLAAVIHQESRFEARAVSSAGARGLMQLMPDTARRLAGVRRLNLERLFEPEFNIRLGTRFLGELRERFGGELEAILAGYNAGGTRVAQWRRQWPAREPAEFVECIPATQTREFVYQVLVNYRFYRELYAGGEK